MKYCYLICVILFFSCNRYSVDLISFRSIPYNGEEIRLNGGYFYFEEGRVIDDYLTSKDRFYGYIFFVNGVVFKTTVTGNEILLNSNFENIDIHRTPLGWGLFKISNNKIVMEQWYGVGNVFSPFPAIPIKGEIISKDKFITKSAFGQQDRKEKTTIYNFYPLNNKPDSVNCYVPKKISKKDCLDFKK